MNVVYHKEAQKNEADYATLQAATKHLTNLLEGAMDPVDIEWDRVKDDRGRPVYVLKLQDFSGSVERRFGAEELTSFPQLLFHVRGLFQELLKIRTHKLMEPIRRNGSREG